MLQNYYVFPSLGNINLNAWMTKVFKPFFFSDTVGGYKKISLSGEGGKFKKIVAVVKFTFVLVCAGTVEHRVIFVTLHTINTKRVINHLSED